MLGELVKIREKKYKTKTLSGFSPYILYFIFPPRYPSVKNLPLVIPGRLYTIARIPDLHLGLLFRKGGGFGRQSSTQGRGVREKKSGRFFGPPTLNGSLPAGPEAGPTNPPPSPAWITSHESQPPPCRWPMGQI